MEQKVREHIVKFFLEKGKFSKEETDKCLSINFIEAGLLDSIEFITLIADIEENFDFVFSEQDFQRASFSTIDGMAKITAEKLRSKK